MPILTLPTLSPRKKPRETSSRTKQSKSKSKRRTSSSVQPNKVAKETPKDERFQIKNAPILIEYIRGRAWGLDRHELRSELWQVLQDFAKLTEHEYAQRAGYVRGDIAYDLANFRILSRTTKSSTVDDDDCGGKWPNEDMTEWELTKELYEAKKTLASAMDRVSSAIPNFHRYPSYLSTKEILNALPSSTSSSSISPARLEILRARLDWLSHDDD
ncbi:hypothetical protein C8Q75DRAFT_805959 [Abortiporus biennis]|nr:hypothetical protein C8Q75DRAFT_805959 [Abortiporus biennis]